MDVVEEIRKIAIAKLASESHFVVDIIVSTKKGPKKVLIILDGDQGITIDDCANLSRELSKIFDELPWMKDESYMLEVSTPGLDQPLASVRQYKKNVGRGLKVKLHDKIIEGKLTAVADEKITLEQETGTGKKKVTSTLEVPFSDIEKAFVLISFK
jgi:ribosome maturation factor RimP